MTIDFNPDQWQIIKETYQQWWAHELDRPILPVELMGGDPGRPQPEAPILDKRTCADFRWSPEQLIDRLDFELSKVRFLGDAFPMISLDCFGPGVMAAFLGARLHSEDGEVWFFPPADLPARELHFEYDPQNIWLRRVKDICAAAVERWQGQVLVGMTDLGGNLDVLYSFRPGEKLLLDLVDHPEEVERLTWEAHHLWHRFYEEIQAVLQPTNPGYSDWSRIYSETPCYMLQCDFSYMISPHMFKRFVLPELHASCRRLPHTFYHLDGVGQLPHLETVCQIPELNGIQWVPGDGKPDCSHWPEVYQKIHNAGKLIQVVHSDFDIIDAVAFQIGTFRGIQTPRIIRSIAAEGQIREKLAVYSIG